MSGYPDPDLVPGSWNVEIDGVTAGSMQIQSYGPGDIVVGTFLGDPLHGRFTFPTFTFGHRSGGSHFDAFTSTLQSGRDGLETMTSTF